MTTEGRHIAGRTVTTGHTPRSYIIETARGEIRRKISQLNVYPSTTDNSSRQAEDLHRSQIMTCSRTGTPISPPERLKPGSQYVAQLRGAARRDVRRSAPRRAPCAASVFTMFVLSGSERDVRRPHPLYPRVRIGATAW